MSIGRKWPGGHARIERIVMLTGQTVASLALPDLGGV